MRRYYREEYDDDFEDVDWDEHPIPVDAVVIDGPIRANNKRGNFGPT